MAILSFFLITISVLFIPTEKLLSKFSDLRKKYRTRYQRGKDLLIELTSLHLLGDLTHLSSYKFYETLILEIAIVTKEYGVATSKTLSKIRHALSKDLVIEKKLAATISETYFQFFLSQALTVLLSIFSSSILELEIDLTFLLFASLYSLIGYFTFALIIKKLERRLLSPVGQALKSFLIFKMLYDVGAPLNYLIEKSKINCLMDLKTSFSHELYRRLAALVELRQNQGMEIKEDLESMEIGLWDEYQGQNEALSSRVTILKFVWLIIFFFTPYVANFFRLVTRLNL